MRKGIENQDDVPQEGMRIVEEKDSRRKDKRMVEGVRTGGTSLDSN